MYNVRTYFGPNRLGLSNTPTASLPRAILPDECPGYDSNAGVWGMRRNLYCHCSWVHYGPEWRHLKGYYLWRFWLYQFEKVSLNFFMIIYFFTHISMIIHRLLPPLPSVSLYLHNIVLNGTVKIPDFPLGSVRHIRGQKKNDRIRTLLSICKSKPTTGQMYEDH